GIEIPCIDITCNIADKDKFDENIALIEENIETASTLNCPFIRLRAGVSSTDKDIDDNVVISLIEKLYKKAENNNVSILIETVGPYSDTKRLRDVLKTFARDSVAALWDFHHTYRYGNEKTEESVQNLGAFIKHVHLKDSEVNDGKIEYCLTGEGTLPIDEMINGLRSINYEGYVSMEWMPGWMEEISDAGIVFPHFVNYMGQYKTKLYGKKHHLYSNKAGTGKFIWEKEKIIDKTFPQVLDKLVEEFPDQYAFKYTTLDYTRTYSEFRDDVDEFARSLIAMGVKQGSHVAVWATNVPQWYIAFWATTKIGAVLVTVNTAYKIHELEYLLRHSDTQILVMVDGFKDCNYVSIVNELCPELANHVAGKPLHCKRLPFLRHVINVSSKQKGCLSWEEALEMAEQVPIEEVYRRASTIDKNDVCNMQYTSGTTGFPKGVMLTHYNVVNNGKCIGDRMDLSTADRMMIQVPMFHCFGMVLAMTASMTHGVTISPLPYFSTKPALACINQERITCFHGVPTMFIAMLEHPDFEKTDFSYMRTGIMAGSPCPISVMQDVVDKMNMKEITIVYGQTEASPGCTMSSTDDPIEVRVGTVGGPLPGVECKIVDPETNEEVPVGVTGEFVARGYNIMKGYYKMPEATAAAIDKDGWLHTGDLAAKTPEGNYRITGRLKDMVIRGGENIYPKEIEEFIYTHEKVKDVQVIGVPDEQLGEELMACIILKEGESMTEDEMKAYVKANMAKHKIPRYIDFVDSFPMNAAGKILKYKMREDAIEKLNLKKADSIETA
nr:AMP-binding protein [Lachnospiraceae bacterium]